MSGEDSGGKSGRTIKQESVEIAQHSGFGTFILIGSVLQFKGRYPAEIRICFGKTCEEIHRSISHEHEKEKTTMA